MWYADALFGADTALCRVSNSLLASDPEKTRRKDYAGQSVGSKRESKTLAADLHILHEIKIQKRL